jgi:hypothetical protein
MAAENTAASPQSLLSPYMLAVQCHVIPDYVQPKPLEKSMIRIIVTL